MKKIFKYIGMIFKGFWKAITFVRLALVNLIFLITLGLLYFIYSTGGSVTPSVAQKSALVLNISGPIVENLAREPNGFSCGFSIWRRYTKRKFAI